MTSRRSLDVQVKLYDAHERPLRRTLGFTGGELVAREDGDETTVAGITPSRSDPLRVNNPGDQEWEDPRCQRQNVRGRPHSLK